MGICLSSEDVAGDAFEKQGKVAKNEEVSTASFDAKNDHLDSNLKSVLKSIDRIHLIASLKYQQKLELASSLVEKVFETGEMLMKQGESGTEFFLIASGRCEVYVGTEKVSELNSNDYCGEQALLNPNSKRTASIKAVEQTTCYVMNRATFNRVVRANNIHFMQRTAHLALSDSISIASDDSSGADDDQDFAMNNHDENLTEDVLSWLTSAVEENLLFADLNKDSIREICKNMTRRKVYPKEYIIRQNDKKANEFFVIEKGSFVIQKDGQKIDSITRGACVGEQALLFNAPRTATVKFAGQSDKQYGIVWCLSRSTYRQCSTKLRRSTDDEKFAFLRRIPLLASLYNSEITLMSRALQKQEFPAGTTIFSQGEEGDKFYLIMDGSVIGHEKGPDGNIAKTFELSKNEWFGELALKYNKPRSATIAAKENAVCLVVSRKDFNSLFGSLDSMMQRQIEEYQRPTQSTKEYRLNLFKRNLGDFEQGPFVGRGKYGSVRFVRDNGSNTTYALKMIKKSWVHAKKAKQSKRRINALFNERNMMRELSNDHNSSSFLIKLRGTFKDETSVYFLMSAATGGDFFNILKTRGYVDEKTAQFYIACLVEGLEFLHSHNMIHRDLKPENIVMDHRGYGMITDFGFTKKLSSTNGNKTYTLCGTPGYMAPEVILGQGYGLGSDWFSLGCVLYDMVTGAPPFPTRADQFTMIKKMMSSKLHLPMYLSFWLKDILCQFLKLKPTKRLGVIKGGAKTIKKHHWFKDFDWEGLRNGTLQAPIKPRMDSAMDPQNFDTTILNDPHVNKEEFVLPLAPELENWDVSF